MLKKTITFTDYNGVVQTEDFYFNLSKSELAEMAIVQKGFDEYLKKIVESEDGGAVLDTFKTILAKSVGVRSEDGRRFAKSKEISEDFMQTGAYEELFMQLVTDAGYAVEFIKGIVPSDMVKEIDEETSADREYTPEELFAMDDDEFVRIVGTDPKRMSHGQLVAAMARKNQATRREVHTPAMKQGVLS